MKKRHIGQQSLPSISHFENQYTVHNVRDFHRESDNIAEEIYTEITIDISHIYGCRIYQSTFGYGDSLAHYMIGFLYKDKDNSEKELIFSIEARRPAGETYSLRKGIIPGMYGIIYTWGTPSDLLSLRKNVRHDPLSSYPLLLEATQCQDLFKYFIHRTNRIIHNQIAYHAVRYNCLTDLHRGLAHCTNKLFFISWWTIMPRGYIRYLTRKGIIKK